MTILSRRDLFALLAVAAGSKLGRAQQAPVSQPAIADTVRDHLWIWAHPAGSYNTARSKDEWPFSDYGFPKTSQMTPVEGAQYLDVPNVVFLRYIGRPSPEGLNAYARMLQPFKRVVWSINLMARRDGPARFAWSSTDEEEHRVIRDLLKRYPNIIGLIMDDYFRTPGEKHMAGPEEVRAFKKTFGHAEFWDAIYASDLDDTSKAHLDMVDVMTLWTRECKDLPHLEANFEKACRMFPRTRKVLGCYMWDYLGEKRPIPIEGMKHQCELGLQWLKAGRVEGICFIGTPMCDMGVEAVEWTRRWIQNVGDQRLPVVEK